MRDAGVSKEIKIFTAYGEEREAIHANVTHPVVSAVTAPMADAPRTDARALALQLAARALSLVA